MGDAPNVTGARNAPSAKIHYKSLYFVSTFYKSQLGDVSFGFKVEIAD